jgi:hypothetical protein
MKLFASNRHAYQHMLNQLMIHGSSHNPKPKGITMSLPQSTSHAGWPEELSDVDGRDYIRVRDGVPGPNEYSGHACQYVRVNEETDQGYDTDFLYVGVRMYDSEPRALIAKQMVHDTDMTSDDRINLSFDTFHDHRNAFYFQINPAGTRSDALIENNRTFRRDWNGIWYAEASVDAEGWSAEFAIPFQTVAFNPGGGTWGFEAERQIRRKNEVARWANPSKNRVVTDIAGIGTLTGLADIDGTGIDLVPNASLRYTWDRSRDGNGTSTDSDLLGNPAADVYYKFHPAMTAALTLNSDFIEAPVDDRRTELTRFPPFLPERRLFSRLRHQFETSPSTAFRYSGGSVAKGEHSTSTPASLTGRLGRMRSGAVCRSRRWDSRDRPGVVRVSAFSPSPRSDHRHHGDPTCQDSTGLLGAYFQYYKSDVLGSNILFGNAFFMRSFTSGAGDDEEMFGANLAYPNDRYNALIGFTQIGDDFNPALGFINRWGIRQYDADFRYRVRPRRLLRTVDTGFETEVVTDRSDDLESAILTFNLLGSRTTRATRSGSATSTTRSGCCGSLSRSTPAS